MSNFDIRIFISNVKNYLASVKVLHTSIEKISKISHLFHYLENDTRWIDIVPVNFITSVQNKCKDFIQEAQDNPETYETYEIKKLIKSCHSIYYICTTQLKYLNDDTSQGQTMNIDNLVTVTKRKSKLQLQPTKRICR